MSRISVEGYSAASESHVKRLQSLINQTSVSKLRRLYQAAQADLERKITRAIGRASSPFTILQYKALLAQVRRGQIEIARAMGTAMSKQTVLIQQAALNQIVLDVRRMEKKTSGAVVQLPIEEAARFTGVIDKRKTSLLRLNKSSMANYGSTVVKKMEQQLSMALVTGESNGDAVQRVMETADVEWWRAERIVRTEQAWAYNATQLDAVTENTSALPDMRLRWTELVDDLTGRPLDDRVAKDSIAMHGQVARPGQPFRMPFDPSVPEGLRGKSWTHPPNRPNDRAVLQPWRPSWGVPGWEMVNSIRVDVR